MARKRNKNKKTKKQQLPDILKDYKEYQGFLTSFINYQKMIYEKDIDMKWICSISLKVGNTK